MLKSQISQLQKKNPCSIKKLKTPNILLHTLTIPPYCASVILPNYQKARSLWYLSPSPPFPSLLLPRPTYAKPLNSAMTKCVCDKKQKTRKKITTFIPTPSDSLFCSTFPLNFLHPIPCSKTRQWYFAFVKIQFDLLQAFSKAGHCLERPKYGGYVARF